MKKTQPNKDRLDQVVARAQREREQREQGYREQALKLYPWICGRCSREFSRDNLKELTVHHRDHNHDNNPTDGSNWELLCVYCHDNEHSRYIDSAASGEATLEGKRETSATFKPFAGLESLLKNKQ